MVPVTAQALYGMAQNIKAIESPAYKLFSLILMLGFIAVFIGLVIVIAQKRKGKPSGIFTDEEGLYSSEYRLLPN